MLFFFDRHELTVSSLGNQFSCSANGLGENPHNAFPHSRDDPFGLTASRALHLPVLLEVLHGLIHDACYCSWKNNKKLLLFWLLHTQFQTSFWDKEKRKQGVRRGEQSAAHRIQTVINGASPLSISPSAWDHQSWSDWQCIWRIIINCNPEKCKQLFGFTDNGLCASYRRTWVLLPLGVYWGPGVLSPLLRLIAVRQCVCVCVCPCASLSTCQRTED